MCGKFSTILLILATINCSKSLQCYQHQCVEAECTKDVPKSAIVCEPDSACVMEDILQNGNRTVGRSCINKTEANVYCNLLERAISIWKSQNTF
ncbi:hypothetical protein QE152_g33772 [Popillia japonica]|uniref:Secreted protein n=1 Tax=Popillia japonica TaxID=7064 RepID=A0AAW1IVS1_POPJA